MLSIRIAKCGFGQEVEIIPEKRIDKAPAQLPELYWCRECNRQLSEARVDFLKTALFINNEADFTCKNCQQEIEDDIKLANSIRLNPRTIIDV